MISLCLYYVNSLLLTTQEHQVLLQHFLMSGEDMAEEEMDTDIQDTDDEVGV